MPGTLCAVAVCKNTRLNTKNSEDCNQISYHRFPKDKCIKQQWINKCKRKGKWNPDTSYVCSAHFTSDSFERNLKAELLNIPYKKKLKISAIPTLNIISTVSDTIKAQAHVNRDERCCRRSNKKLVSDLLTSENSATAEQTDLIEQKTCSDTDVTNIFENNASKCDPGEDVEMMKKDNLRLKREVNSLRKRLSTQRKTVMKLNNTVNSLWRAKQSLEAQQVKTFRLIRKVFSENQIKVLMAKSKQVRWTNEELSLAFTLRYLSKRSYLYVKRALKIPLPSLTCLKRWASTLDMTNGILSDVLKFMKIAASKMTETEKVCTLAFDEMKVKQMYEYDVQNDKVVGPYSQMQVIMARGIFSAWKQPVYIAFDTKITKEIIDNVVNAISSIGFRVKACVSDMGGGNIGLWKELKVNKEQNWYCSPCNPQEKNYFFPDAPHILKLIRNWLLDTGFVLESGKVVDTRPLTALVRMQADSDLKMCPNLTEQHLNVNEIERQNVPKAAQLLSFTTAAALTKSIKTDDCENVKETSQFIETVAKWFHLMNTYTPAKSVIGAKNAYGNCKKEQDKILGDMLDLIKTMRCGGKRVLQTFQKGCIISINSVKELFSDLKSSFPSTEYIMTHRLNQDALENFFSQIRTRGGLNDHPTPLNALNRIRMIILGKNQCHFKNNQHDKEPEGSEFLIASVITNAGLSNELQTIDENCATESLMWYESKEKATKSGQSSEQTYGANEMVSNGLEYLAGWVAKKYFKCHPELGEYTKRGNTLNPDVLPSWVSHLSYERLISPSKEWMSYVLQVEVLFGEKHGKSISKELGVVANLCTDIEKRLAMKSFPLEVTKSLIRQRTFIRIKFLNETLSNKRPASSDLVMNNLKKIKKFIN